MRLQLTTIALFCIALNTALVSGRNRDTWPASSSAEPPRITEQNSGTSQFLQAVHAVSSSVVWAAGYGGTVLRSTDGGETWQQLRTPVGDSLQFRDVHALNADTAWLLSIGNGSASRIYRTNNGGSTWTLQFINRDTAAFYDCISFEDPRHGVAFGDASHGRSNILRSSDGGATWTQLPQGAAPSPLAGEGAFAASGQCVAHSAGEPGRVFIATGSPGARLFRSSDAGSSWEVIETPFVKGTVAGLTGVDFRGSRGIAVAADINRLRTDTSSNVVGTSSDGGSTWTLGTRPPLPGALAGVAWVPGAGPGFAAASGYGGAFYTSDSGQSWTTITDLVTAGVSAYDRTVWIAGANGKIWRLDFPVAKPG